MNKQDISKLFSDLGRKGGKARAKSLTPARRKEIATKASKAAAGKRIKKKGSAEHCDARIPTDIPENLQQNVSS
jgi:hypothetical protein